MLTFDHVKKFVLTDLTLHIPRGVAVGIIGASGAGKTTLLRLACGLLAPEQGEVYTMQKSPVEKRNQLGSCLGCILERMPVLDEERSVADNMKNLKIIYQLPEEEFQREYETLADKFGLREFEHALVKSLSFGQRRRAELTAVLLHKPELLLLDEPTNGLDENAKSVFRDILKERVRKGLTVVLTSHDMKEVSGMCQRILLLEQGKLVYYGEESALLRQYAPMDIMELRLEGKTPDLEDLPVARYELQEEKLILTYNSNYVTASEILEVLLRQISVKEITIRKPDLADVILAIRKEAEKSKEEETKP